MFHLRCHDVAFGGVGLEGRRDDRVVGLRGARRRDQRRWSKAERRSALPALAIADFSFDPNLYALDGAVP